MITHEEAEAYFAAKAKRQALNGLGKSPLAGLPADATSSEIKELAYALRWDPKLIFEYVHNNIDYVPYYGSRKGALLTYLDGSGNDFDQASLMIALLKESQIHNTDISDIYYVQGIMTIPGKETNSNQGLANWFGVDSAQVPVGEILGASSIPITGSVGSTGTATIDRVLVQAKISGQIWLFDPAFKEYVYPDYIYSNSTNPTTLDAAMGYNRSTLLSAAGGIPDDIYNGSYYSIRSLNESNIRNTLTSYATNLINNIKINEPNADVLQIIRGRRIKQTSLTNYASATSYPLQSQPAPVTWAESSIPAIRISTLRIQHGDIDTNTNPWNIHDLGGKRITITYTSDSKPKLCIDGTSCITGTQPITGPASLTITINHPLMDAYPHTYTIKGGGTYAIVYSFGGISDKLLQKRQQQLNTNKILLSLPEDSEAIRGETLNLIGLTWLKDVTMVRRLAYSLYEFVAIDHHRIGVVGQTTQPSYYVDVGLQLACVARKHNGSSDWTLPCKVDTLIASAFEHGVLEQLVKASNPGVSTVKLLDVANNQGAKIFYANSSNWSDIKTKLGNVNDANKYTSTDLAYFESQILGSNPYTLILPDRKIALNQWTGQGYIQERSIGSGHIQIGMIISGGDLYGGGESSYNDTVLSTDVSPKVLQNINNATDPLNNKLGEAAPHTSTEPVDMASGAYLHDQTDLALGGGAPLGLAFSRSYNSNRNLSKRTLGYGWTHNNDIYLTFSSHSEPGLGSRQPVDAAAMIVAIYAGLDLLQTDSIQPWMIVSLASKWAVDQMINNALTVNLGHKMMEFIKLPDGTYASPPGITTKLINNGSTYSLQERLGTTISFNTDNRISQITDIDSNTMIFNYTGSNLSSVRDAFNRTLTINYSGDTISSVYDSISPGRTVSYGYDGSGNLTTCTDPELKNWGYGYNADHRTTTLTNPLSITTATNFYDTLGRVKTQRVPRQGGGTADYSFYFSGFRNQEVDPAGNALTYYYDEKGREYAEVDPLCNKVAKIFDGQDHVVQTVDPRSYTTAYLYDGNQNLTRITNYLGYYAQNTYNAAYPYLLTDATDPLGHNTHFAYDSEYHLTGTLDAVGNTTGASYYANGFKQTATDGRNIISTLTYDTFGNPKTSKTAGHPVINYTYDAIGRMANLADQVGSSTAFYYDKRNLLTSKTDPLGKAVSFTYYNDGSVHTKTDRKNNTITYSYTQSGKPESITYPNTPTVNFTYNQLDNLMSMQDSTGTTGYTYDAANRLISKTDPRNFVISYQYDANNNVTMIVYPGNKAVNYTYDALNRLKTVTNWLNQTVTYNYDVAGRLTDFTNFNGTVTTYAYDNANRLTSLENRNTAGGTVISTYQFPTLDGNGNRTSVVQNEPYTQSWAAALVSYSYNSQKNRLTSAGSNSFTYDDEGQLNTGYSTSYTFDYEHRLTGIGTTQFIYDIRGNRLQATRSGTVTKYIYDASGNLVAEADTNNNITRYYIYGNGLLAMVTPANAVYCYHYNATGSTVAITDSSKVVQNKYSYDPFGNVMTQTEAVTQPFKYVGQFGVMTEPNGFYYMRARFYDPAVGRFVSEDPSGFEGGDVNLMAYVSGNPVLLIDPWGLCDSYTGNASYYNLPGNKTASGTLFNANTFAGAMTSDKVHKLPTTVTVTFEGNSIQVEVNDRGPFMVGADGKAIKPLQPHPTRIIDLTPAAFKALSGSLKSGVIPVTVEVPR